MRYKNEDDRNIGSVHIGTDAYWSGICPIWAIWESSIWYILSKWAVLPELLSISRM
jgi:hypothetical protein